MMKDQFGNAIQSIEEGQWYRDGHDMLWMDAVRSPMLVDGRDVFRLSRSGTGARVYRADGALIMDDGRQVIPNDNSLMNLRMLIVRDPPLRAPTIGEAKAIASLVDGHSQMVQTVTGTLSFDDVFLGDGASMHVVSYDDPSS